MSMTVDMIALKQGDCQLDTSSNMISGEGGGVVEAPRRRNKC